MKVMNLYLNLLLNFLELHYLFELKLVLVVNIYELSRALRLQGSQARLATSRNSQSPIGDAFSNFSLLSSKYLDYNDWSKAAQIILSNQHLTQDGANIIDKLKSEMNNARTSFNWDHLNF
jgi:hypothetical protein